MSNQEQSAGVRQALLDAQLLGGAVNGDAFIKLAADLGGDAAAARADKLLAIAANQAALRAQLRDSYDYIVIGSGAAGSVVARRLAEDRVAQVLLLEAGGSDLESSMLVTESWFMAQGTGVDWNFEAEASTALNGRAIRHAAGRAIGGSTSINGMVWARGHRLDFEDWAAMSGDQAWGYEHVLGIYKRIEDWHGAPDSARRGSGGPVFVQPAPDAHPMAHALLRAAAATGVPIFDSQNGLLEEGDGGALTSVRIRDGRRLNIPADYLYPVMDQPNLTVLTGAQVTRLLIGDGVATGVEFDWQGQRRRIGASAEIILSAGALNTPKILMLSGVGDRDELLRHGIAVTAHVPGVGRNFQDHPIIGAGLWQSPQPIASRNNSAEANILLKSRAGLDRPDLHIWQVEGPYLSETTGQYYADNTWSITPGLVRPLSRGQVRLRSADPYAAPLIQSNMLSAPEDMAALREGMRISRELGNSQSMSAYVSREILPGNVGGKALDDLIRAGAMSMHHPTSTAAMGRDDMAVVDAELRVRGVKRLRVADASIMPIITTGNTQAPSVIIGERMAEILRAFK
jgi:choline dehydrogenase